MPEGEMTLFLKLQGDLANYADRGERLKGHMYSERGIYETWEQRVLFIQDNEYYLTDDKGHMKDITHGLGMASWGGVDAKTAKERIAYACGKCKAPQSGVIDVIIREADTDATLPACWFCVCYNDDCQSSPDDIRCVGGKKLTAFTIQ